jgi:7-cyano-7-deazaguanine synthase
MINSENLNNLESLEIKSNVKNAIVLFSGGLDSSTVLKIALDEGYNIIPVSFFYNQRHQTEIDHAKKIIEYFKIKNHIIINLDFSQIKGSALVDLKVDVPKNQIKLINACNNNNYDNDNDNKNDNKKNSIPITYVPARNTIFLSYAIAVGEVNNAGDIFIGVNWIDYSGYPDCRPEYILAFEQMANIATKVSVTGELEFKIHTPLINMGKKDIIKKAYEIGVPLELTHSCYDPINGLACGVCDSCILRKNGFIEAGIKDSTVYAQNCR